MYIIRFKKNEFLKRENHKKKDRGNGSLCPFCLFWRMQPELDPPGNLSSESEAPAKSPWGNDRRFILSVYTFDFLRRAGFFCKTSAVRLGR